MRLVVRGFHAFQVIAFRFTWQTIEVKVLASAEFKLWVSPMLIVFSDYRPQSPAAWIEQQFFDTSRRNCMIYFET